MRLSRLLETKLKAFGEVVTEATFRAVAEFDIRGAPELAAHCLANGAVEFWIVEAAKQSVTVVSREGGSVAYSAGGSVPLARFGAGELPVDEIFA